MSLIPFLRRPRARDRLSAREYNQLLDAIERLERAVREPEGQMQATMMAKMTAAGPADLTFWARIEAVNVGTAHPNSLPGQPAYTASTVTYNVRGIARPGLVLTAATPFYGRPVRYNNALIHPARPNDLCFVEVFRQASNGELVSRLGLLQGCEVVARRQCASGL